MTYPARGDLSRSVLIYLVVLTHLLTSACSVMQPVPAQNTDALVAELQSGDEVVVYTRRGEKIALTIDSIDQEKLVGGGREIPLSDIERVQRKEVSVARSAGTALGVVLLIAALTVAYALIDLAD